MLPSPRSDLHQLQLFPKELLRGSSRNICGDMAERCTEKLTGGKRLKTDCRIPFCPDIECENHCCEVKSVRHGSKTILYQHRIEKEKAFTAEGGVLEYWFWIHKANFKKCETEDDVRQAWARGIHCVCIIDFPSILRLIEKKETETINNSYYSNHSPNGVFKGSGWLLPTRVLIETCKAATNIEDLQVLKNSIKPFQLYRRH